MTVYYPVHLDLAGKLCVVVGGGHVAERKVGGLLEANARVRVVALEATSVIRDLSLHSTIELILAPYDRAYLEGAWLVLAATDNHAVNASVAADARAVNVWVNRADAFGEGDFTVPAVVRHGELCLSIATGGNQPLLTARIARELERRFGPEYADYIALLGTMRAEIKAGIANAAVRREAMMALLDAEERLCSLLRTGAAEDAHVLARLLVANRRDIDAHPATGTVSLEEIPAAADTGG